MTQVPLQSKVLSENQRIADSLRERFAAHQVLCINLVSSPGSGKTTLLERTLEGFPPETPVAVLTGDIQTERDAERLARFGFPVKQITTGGICHLDGRMIERALADWPLEQLDLLLVENVGNLVCPSSYDLGEAAKVVVLSVTEGEEKPLKYPSMFFKSELLVLNKIDLLKYVPFDIECRQRECTQDPSGDRDHRGLKPEPGRHDRMVRLAQSKAPCLSTEKLNTEASQPQQA